MEWPWIIIQSRSKFLNNAIKIKWNNCPSKANERQNISTCLRVFCDETLAALETHLNLREIDVSATIEFILIFIKFWKIVNVKAPGEEIVNL